MLQEFAVTFQLFLENAKYVHVLLIALCVHSSLIMNHLVLMIFLSVHWNDNSAEITGHSGLYKL